MKKRRVHWIFRTWSRMLQGRTGTGCPSYDEEAGGPPTLPLIRNPRSAIHNLRSTICNPSFLRPFVFIRGSNSSFQFSAFTPWGGTNVGTGRKFPKKVSVPAYPAFACAVKARKMRGFKVQVGSLKGRGGGRRGRRTGDRGQRTEVRGGRSEEGGQRREVRERRSEDGMQREL